MTPRQEAAIWRTIGRGFEQLAETGVSPSREFEFGLCRAARLFGLPAYSEADARVTLLDNHDKGWESVRDAASHRALTAYLVAEMVLDGRAPEGPDGGPLDD